MTTTTKKYFSLKEEKPEVIFPKEVHDKIMYWVHKSPIEISGFGKCIMKDGAFHVLSAHLAAQENTSHDTELDPGALGKLMYEIREEEGHFNFWWHSHVNMGVFWSSTDDDTIKQIGDQGFCLATVFNKKDEMRSAYYQGAVDDKMPGIFLDKLPTFVAAVEVGVVPEWDEEYEAKCKVKTFPTTTAGRAGVDPYNFTTKRRYNHVYGSYEEWDPHWMCYIPDDHDSPPPKTEAQKTMSKSSGSKTTSMTDTDSVGEVTTTWPYNEPHDVLEVVDKERFSGSIHPVTHNLRWSEDRQCWMDYSLFMAEFPADLNNILDYFEIRPDAVRMFVNERGYPPVDDFDVDKFYIEKNQIRDDMFYDPKVFLENIEAAKEATDGSDSKTLDETA